MRAGRRKLVWAFLAALTAASVPSARGGTDDPKTAGPPPRRPSAGQARALTLDADMTVSPPAATKEKPTPVHSWTRVDYSLDRKPAALTVTIHELSLLVKQNGETIQKSALNRNSLRLMPLPGEEVKEIPFATGQPNLQLILRDFDTPAVSLTLDANGREADRKLLLTGPNAKNMAGWVDTILSIHTPFSATQPSWEAPAAMVIGEGYAARGNLRFEKVGVPTDGPVKVRVTGDLKLDGSIGPAKYKNGLYHINGEQVYDPAANEWSAAVWNLTISAELASSTDQPLGSVKATMVVTMAAPSALKNPDDAIKDTPAAAKPDKP